MRLWHIPPSGSVFQYFSRVLAARGLQEVRRENYMVVQSQSSIHGRAILCCKLCPRVQTNFLRQSCNLNCKHICYSSFQKTWQSWFPPCQSGIWRESSTLRIQTSATSLWIGILLFIWSYFGTSVAACRGNTHLRMINTTNPCWPKNPGVSSGARARIDLTKRSVRVKHSKLIQYM